LSTFVDASVMVAILGNEEDCIERATELSECKSPIASPLSVWESMVGLHRSHNMAFEDAEHDVYALLAEREIEVVAIGREEMAEALEAYRKFGKGRHPAQLNLGDCFAYACCKLNDAKLLYKGEDFSKTDLA
jgi:ribonuclease VapC